MKVYVSSTVLDLAEHRRAVIASILRSGHTPVCMEHHAASGVIPVDECLREVASCEAYVGLFAWRYGFVPPGSEDSITKMEYQTALSRMPKSTLVFLSDPNFAWPSVNQHADEDRAPIEELRNKLQLAHWFRFFTTPDHCASEVLAAIGRVVTVNMAEEFRRAGEATQSDLDRLEAELKKLKEEQAQNQQTRRDRRRDRVPIPIPVKLVRHFQDRTAELLKLRQCLANRNLRMVSVCGPGGMGKTSLIAKLVRELTESGESGDSVDGVIFVPLGEEAFRTPERIVECLARALESEAVAELNETWNQEGVSLRERLAGLFRGPLTEHRFLIVLDNLESVLDEDNRIPSEYAALRQMIEAALEYDHATLLIITSRRALSLSPEAEIIAIGRRILIPLEEGLPEAFAVALLRELDGDGRLGIREAVDETLLVVVRRCQCIPRTLETLVGTLLQHFTWTLDNLLENDALFTRLVEDPARELYASLSSDPARLVMQALAIFDRPVPSAAIRSILPALPIDEILDHLVRDFVAAYDGKRFWLHPLDRQIAYSQIPEQGSDYSRAAWHQRAAQFYARLHLPAEGWKTIGDVEPQLNEFQHLVRAGLHDEACRVLNDIDREHLSTWGHSQLIIKLRLQLLEHIRDRALTGLNWGNLGCAYLDSGDAEEAKAWFERTLAVARETRDRANEGRFQGNFGLTLEILGNRPEATERLGEALAIAKEIGDGRHEGRWLGNLTQLQLSSGQVEVPEAIGNYERAVALANQVNDQRFVMIWSVRLGEILTSQSEWVRAQEQFTRALAAAQRIGARSQTCRILLQLSVINANVGNKSEQEKYAQLAREALGEMQSPVDVVSVLLDLAAIYSHMGQPDPQRQCHEEATEIALTFGDKDAERRLLLILGDRWLESGDGNRAMKCFGHVRDKARVTAVVGDEETALLRMAGAADALGFWRKAPLYYEELLRTARQANDRPMEVIALIAYANSLLSAGDVEKAITHFDFALPIVGEMNDQANQLRILNRLGMAAYLLEDMSTAVRYYERMLAIARELGDRGNQSIALFNIGDAYHFAGDLPQAVRYYQDSLALDVSATRCKCKLGLGMACLQSGQQREGQEHFSECIESLQEALRSSPAFHPQLAALGLALLAVGKTPEGLDTYRRGLELAPPPELLKYALQDLRLLQNVPQPIAGLNEAIDMIESALSSSSNATD